MSFSKKIKNGFENMEWFMCNCSRRTGLAPKIEKIEQPSIERSRQMRHHNSQVNQKIFKPGYSFS
jgi:hypothetical protein